jgi:hypothetical protein
MTIHLSDQSAALVHQLAARSGFKSVDAYLDALIQREHYCSDGEQTIREMIAKEGEDPASVSNEKVEAGRRRIEALLLEGIDSGPCEVMTRERWEEMRKRLEAKLDGMG